jgi:hypothetical protein
MLNEFLLATAYSPFITQMQIIIEIATANQPEYFIGVVRRDTGMICHTNYGFE